MAVHVVDHPLVRHKLGILRKESTSTSEFRMLAKEISRLLTYEATKHFKTEKRVIKVAVYSQGGFAMLRFEHYTEAAPALDADGLPQQGSDLKSVRTTVGQHGGSMTMHWENNWCTLRILFPLPKKQ